MKLQRNMQSITLALAITLTGAFALTTIAADKPAIDPTGTWKVTVVTTNTQARPNSQTLKLKLDAGTLTGILSYNSGPIVNGKAPVSELPITEAKLDGDQISFNFSHPPAAGNGPNTTYSYEGKISGDSIQGTFTANWMGNTRTRGWEAKRQKR